MKQFDILFLSLDVVQYEVYMNFHSLFSLYKGCNTLLVIISEVSACPVKAIQLLRKYVVCAMHNPK